MGKLDLSVIILTKNEELHIRRCLDRIHTIAKDVFIVDSFSTDQTIEIAKEYSEVTILQNKWVNYATQFNWALENAVIKTKWVLRLDADEYLSEELKQELEEKLPSLDEKYTGIVLPLQRVFLGRKIKHGIARGIRMLRIFQNGKARSEIRQMDEHIELIEGQSIQFNSFFYDDNLNTISWWVQKHVGYAKREAVDLLDIEYNLIDNANTLSVGRIDSQALIKRHKKTKYSKKPLFWRSFCYFLYRYFLKLGFLDGKEGFLWDFMQGWWYRTLVDTNVYQAKKYSQGDKERLREFIRNEFGISL